MKKRTFYFPSLIFLAAGCIGLLAGGGTSLRAQQPPPTSDDATFDETASQDATIPGTATLIAVVDIPTIFKTHPTFKIRMESIQQELKVANKELETKRNELNARSQQLNRLDPSSQDYRRLESELARQVANLQVQARQAKKEFMLREAQQYYAVYQEIISAVHQIALQYDISLVLRFDSVPVDPDTPQSVFRGINRTLVMHRNFDITPLVTQHLQVTLAQNNNQVRSPRH